MSDREAFVVAFAATDREALIEKVAAGIFSEITTSMRDFDEVPPTTQRFYRKVAERVLVAASILAALPASRPSLEEGQ